jgi:hypothetical protein
MIVHDLCAWRSLIHFDFSKTIDWVILNNHLRFDPVSFLFILDILQILRDLSKWSIDWSILLLFNLLYFFVDLVNCFHISLNKVLRVWVGLVSLIFRSLRLRSLNSWRYILEFLHLKHSYNIRRSFNQIVSLRWLETCYSSNSFVVL